MTLFFFTFFQFLSKRSALHLALDVGIDRTPAVKFISIIEIQQLCQILLREYLKVIIQGRILEKVITRFLLLEQTNFKESVQYPLNFIFSLIYASNSIYFLLYLKIVVFLNTKNAFFEA